VISLSKRFPTVALNIINFLTDRISFLNEKIATFSGNTVEEKLISYIDYKSRLCGTDSFDFNKSRAADAINCGRASVYRALEDLTQRSIVGFDGKKLFILNYNYFERKEK
jgi:CRP-like cAMP-binding protein